MPASGMGTRSRPLCARLPCERCTVSNVLHIELHLSRCYLSSFHSILYNGLASQRTLERLVSFHVDDMDEAWKKLVGYGLNLVERDFKGYFKPGFDGPQTTYQSILVNKSNVQQVKR